MSDMMNESDLRLSDRVRLEYIRHPKPKLNIKESMFDFLYKCDDLIYVERDGNALNYYEGYNNNCLNAFKKSYKLKDFEKVVVARMEKIADIAGYTLDTIDKFWNKKVYIEENSDYPYAYEIDEDFGEDEPLDIFDDEIKFYVKFRLVPKLI